MIATTLEPGTLVRYADTANPGTTYEVVAVHDNPWSTFELRDVETGDTHWTDGRQNGWSTL